MAMPVSPMGLVECTNTEYHEGPGISKSHLDCIAGKSPLHYWARYRDPNRERNNETPAKQLGTAIHSIILEPDLFTKHYAVNPGGFDRRTNVGKAEWAAFLAENQGKIILEDDGYQKCLAIRDAVNRHPLASGLLRAPGKAEQAFFALEPDTGELVKCRLDYMHDGGAVVVDVKSTEDASPSGFGKSAANYRYFIQPPWYFDILETLYGETPRHWAFLALEKDPPFAIGIYYATQDQMDIGREFARRDMLRITKLIAAEKAWQEGDPPVWVDYATEVAPLELPKWFKGYGA